jgi:hypothetical protein
MFFFSPTVLGLELRALLARQALYDLSPTPYLEEKKKNPGIVTHACKPSYWGGGNWENHNSRPAIRKSSQDPISINEKLGVVGM